MGDRPGSSSRVHTSEDKVYRKYMCWSVRIVCVLIKLPDVSEPGLGEAIHYPNPRRREDWELSIWKHIMAMFG